MKQCVLGAGVGDPMQPPPCQGCIAYSQLFTGAAPTAWFEYDQDPKLEALLAALSPAEMMDFTYQDLPLGKLVLPSLRWILRRHHLKDDATTRYLYSAYILSANNIAAKFRELLEGEDPEAVVVFNGLQYAGSAKNRGSG
jgi:hypothetical protein